jgi:Tol biopolymer transport system component
LAIPGAVIVAAVAGLAIGRGREPRPAAIVTSFTQLTDQPGFERQPTISPDGRSVVYVSDARGNADLYLLRVGGRNAVLLTADSTADDYAPAYSHDGNRIAFRSERAGGGIFVMEATGESVRRISDFGFDPQWSPDGKSLVVAEEAIVDPLSRTSYSSLWVIDIDSGRRRRVARADAVGGRWSPDGRRLAYWGRDRVTGNRDLFTVASDGSQAESPVTVTDDAWVDWSPAWSPDGRYLYFASNRGGTMNLWRVPIDQIAGRATGAPEPLTTPTAWSGWFDLSADGTHAVFADFDERATVWTTAFDPVRASLIGSPRAVLQGRAINSIDVSAAGDSIAFSQRGQPLEALGTMRIDGSGWSRLTDADVYHRLPSWSPDGQRLVFYRSNGLWLLRNDGSELRQVTLSSELAHPMYPVWSPAGDRIAAAGDDFLSVIDVSVSPPRPIVVKSVPPDAPGFVPFSWSADGRWLAGSNLRTMSRDQVFIVDSQLNNPPRSVATTGKSPAWLPDSRRLIYSSPSGIVVLDVESGRERELLPLPRTELPWGRLLSLSRDGHTLAYLQSHDEGDLWLMTIGAK